MSTSLTNLTKNITADELVFRRAVIAYLTVLEEKIAELDTERDNLKTETDALKETINEIARNLDK